MLVGLHAPRVLHARPLAVAAAPGEAVLADPEDDVLEGGAVDPEVEQEDALVRVVRLRVPACHVELQQLERGQLHQAAVDGGQLDGWKGKRCQRCGCGAAGG